MGTLPRAEWRRVARSPALTGISRRRYGSGALAEEPGAVPIEPPYKEREPYEERRAVKGTGRRRKERGAHPTMGGRPVTKQMPWYCGLASGASRGGAARGGRLRNPLGRRGLLDRRRLHGLGGRGLLGRSRLRRGGLGPGRGRLRHLARRHELLEARARTERRHGRLLHLHRLAGAWVARGPGSPNALLKHAEPRDRHLVALGHGGLDLGEYRVERSGRRLPVAQTSRERFDELGLVHECFLPYPLLSFKQLFCAHSSPSAPRTQISARQK